MPRVGPQTYREAQLAARAQAGDLSAEIIRRIQASMIGYSNQLSASLSSLPVGIPADDQILAVQRLFANAGNQLGSLLETQVGASRANSFLNVLNIWKRSSLEVASLNAIPSNLLGGVLVPPVSLLGAYEGVGNQHWRTLLQRNVRRGIDETAAIVRNGLIEGVPARVLAKRLQPYVRGAEPFLKAFSGVVPDARTIAAHPSLRGAAKQMNFNARRIAFSEIHNARAEAEIQHFAADPMIEAVGWRLAPDRGKIGGPDACDTYAQSDLYDLGEGVFPVDAVPVPPHPFDRCERVPIVRDPDQVGKPKPQNLQRQSAHNRGVVCR